MRLTAIIIAVGIASSLLVGCGGQATRQVMRLPDPVTLPSGLIVQEFRIGDGATVDRGQVATISCTTYLENGDLIESSKEYTFPAGIGKVIMGWDEAVGTMQVGGQRKLIIPPYLAYGAAGRPPDIPPDATLTTYIELLRLVPEQTTDQNVKYYDMVDGFGDIVQNGDTLVVNYTGWLQADGTKFDSSLDEGREPFEFVIGQGNVIKGWDNGLLSMGVGGKRVLIIPPEMGYGDQGNGSKIPGGATLIFEIELLEARPGL